MSFSRVLRVNVTVGADEIATTVASSVSYAGVTFTFDTPLRVGYFPGPVQAGEATGEPFVISDQAFSITSITPAATDVNSDGNLGHGAMLGSEITEASVQGFDEYMNVGNQNAKIPYSAALNVDPAVGGALSFSAGARDTVIKQVRAAASTFGSWLISEKYVCLTVLDTVPQPGTLRPGYAGTAKKLRRRQDVSYVPRNYTLPPSFPPAGEVIANMPSNLAIFVGNPENRRRAKLDQLFGTSNDGYSGEFTPFYGRFVYLLNSGNLSAAQRQHVEDATLTHANDVESLVEAGFDFKGGRGENAGQGGGVWLWLMAGAAMTGDTAFLTAANSFIQPMQPVGNGHWITHDDVDISTTAASGINTQTYLPAHIGTPNLTPDEETSAHSGRYVSISATITGWEQVATLAFASAPPGYSDGLAMILNNGPNDETNQFAASLSFLARYRTWGTPAHSSAYAPQSSWKEAWDQIVAEVGFTPWSGIPDQPPQADAAALNDTYFSAGSAAGTIRLDTQGIGFATEPVVRRDVRYSLDQIQWIELSDVTLSGSSFTISGLLNSAEHWCSWRRHSASGPSPWSANFPYSSGGSDRGRVTTLGGSSATAPSYAGGVAPLIHTTPVPAWQFDYWEPTTALQVLASGDIALAAGVGYPSAGFPAPTYTYQWQRSDDGASGWADIAGATTARYTRTSADADKFLRCEIVAANASGSVTVQTNTIRCPAIPALAATTLIDTDFGAASSIDYADQFAAAVSTRSDVDHDPYITFADADGPFSRGGVRYTNGAGSGAPTLFFPLKNSAVAGTVYDVTVQVVGNNAVICDYDFAVVNAAGDVVLDGGVVQLTHDPDFTNNVFNITGTITVAPGETDLDFRLRSRITNGPGGTYALISQATITEL